MNDLAYYICLSALMSCDRKELKNTVLKAVNFTLLTGSLNETKLIIEQFLNGDYHAFQQSLSAIQSHLVFDPIVGEHTSSGNKLFREIRLKALLQYT